MHRWVVSIGGWCCEHPDEMLCHMGLGGGGVSIPRRAWPVTGMSSPRAEGHCPTILCAGGAADARSSPLGGQRAPPQQPHPGPVSRETQAQPSTWEDFSSSICARPAHRSPLMGGQDSSLPSGLPTSSLAPPVPAPRGSQSKPHTIYTKSAFSQLTPLRIKSYPLSTPILHLRGQGTDQSPN